jgi:hypothetical protein
LAEVVEARDLDDLRALGERARGRIVLFNKQIRADGGSTDGYGAGARIRYRGASEAAKLGAVGMLLRSLGTAFMRTPHTGSMAYEDGVARIPAAAVTAEDADLIHRLLSRGPVRVRYRLGCRTLPDVESHNVVADWPGRDKPDEVVLIGAHLDSWDLGVGAVDDGAGVAMVMETLRLFKTLSLRPRRTVRAVLYMNEENGLRGGKGYAEAHAAELARHVAAIEADSGAGRPLGFSIAGGPGADAIVKRLAAALRGIDADEVTVGGDGGADISVLGPYGVPLLGLRQDARRYFDWHHTPADTVDKIDPRELALATAAMATMAYGIADLPEPLPRAAPRPEKKK